MTYSWNKWSFIFQATMPRCHNSNNLRIAASASKQLKEAQMNQAANAMIIIESPDSQTALLS